MNLMLKCDTPEVQVPLLCWLAIVVPCENPL